MKKLFTALFTAVVSLAMFSFCQSASAATIYINSSTGDDTSGAGTIGSPYQTFTKGYTMSSSGDTLDLTGTFTWTDASETGDVASSGYVIDKNLTIRGQAVASTIVQANAVTNTADRGVFLINTSRTVTIQDLTIRNGVQTTAQRGGGVSNLGTLTLLRTRVTGNKYNSTGYYGAGGVYSDTNSTITINNSTIDTNTFIGRYYGAGGFWALQNVPIIIDKTTIANNTATSDNPNTFPYSYADVAGGMGSFRFGLLRITNSTITGNSTNSYGGGLNIYYKDTVTMTNCTVTNNTAGYGAGGMFYQSEWNGYTLYLKNSILADNTASSTASDFYAYDASSGSRVTSNGYNIVETSTNKTFNATGDITGNQASLNISSTLADNATTQGTQTLALSTGSVAINAGDPANTANNGVAIPTTDQRGVVRAATTDIGAYEYPGVSSYTFTYTAGSNGSITGSSTQIVNSGANGSAVTAVPSEGYTFVSWSDASTTNPRTDYGAVGNVSVTATFADVTAPVLSSIGSTPLSTTSTIAWTTNELASSKVEFGPTSSYGSSTSEGDTSPGVTSHAVTLSGLTPCVSYHYRVVSRDASSNSSTSTDATFTTNGCAGYSSIASSTEALVDPSVGATLSMLSSGNGLSVQIPTSYAVATTDVQIKQLVASTVVAAIGRPTGTSEAGNYVYQLNALTSTSTALISSNAAMTVTLTYADADFAGLHEPTLQLYSWDGSSWSVLTNCVVNEAVNHVVCELSRFGRAMGLFAVQAPSVSTGGPGSSSKVVGTRHAGELLDAVLAPTNVSLDKSVSVAPVVEVPSSPMSKVPVKKVAVVDVCRFAFTRDLKLGHTGEDVKQLQACLKARGYAPLQKNGQPMEQLTLYFGPATKTALAKFQKANGMPTTGFFGPMSKLAVSQQQSLAVK